MANDDAMRTLSGAATERDGVDAALEKAKKELDETRAALRESHAAQRAMDADLDDAEKAMERAEREIEDLRRRLDDARDRQALVPAAAKISNPGTNHEEIWELKRRISNLVAELQLAEIDKEKLRQLREAAETRRVEAEARYANAEVEVARSRAAINRVASLETDLQRALAAKESSDEKHHAQLRAVTSEAEHRNAKLESELKFTAKQLERKREKKRAHKAQAVELAHKLKHAVSIAKDTARDAEKAIAQAKAEAAQNATGAVARSKETAERNAATAAASAANAAQLSDALERKRRKKKAYKSQLEDATAKTAESREEAKRAKTALANARALAEADHAVAEAALSRAAAEHEAEKEALTNRVRELESALRHAARDYKRVVAESEPTKQALGVSEHTAEQIRVENLGLAAGLKQAEDACRVFERQAAEARAALAAAEKDFAKQLEANRRAWEQASQGKYLGLDPFAGPGVDGPPPPERRKETGKENRDREEIDDESLFEGKELTPSQMRPAGMTSEHLERVARRDRNKYAQRQKDLGFGARPDFFDFERRE